MKLCKCVSCSISRALENKEIPKELADMFLLGYHYYGMTHEKEDVDAGWHAEGVEFYSNEILKKDFPVYNKRIKRLLKIIKNAKVNQWQTNY